MVVYIEASLQESEVAAWVFIKRLCHDGAKRYLPLAAEGPGLKQSHSPSCYNRAAWLNYPERQLAYVGFRCSGT